MKMEKKKSNGVTIDEIKRDGSSFCTSPCRNLVFYLSVLHLTWRPARSWVQRAEVLGDSLVLFYQENPFLMESIPSFVSCSSSFFFFFSSTPPTRLNYSFGFGYVHVLAEPVCQESAQLGSDVWCENSACKPSLCLHYLWCRSFFVFFFVFGLLVALSIISGDLKLCRECVIVDFSRQASSLEEQC